SLPCATDPSGPADLLKTCLKALTADTRQYATWIAVRDLDAVRARLGADRINLWGASYGTRVALEYLRQFPERARTAVIDGVAPSDMVLPAAYAIDAEEALRKLVAQCPTDARGAAQYPDFESRIDALLARADRGLEVEVRHPLTGATEKLRVDRHLLAGLLRSPLHGPTLGAILPHAVAAAGAGDLGPLVTATASIGSRVKENFSVGMHFAVVCAEDLPLLVGDRAASAAGAVPARFGSTFADFYRDVCQAVAIRPVPAEVLKVGGSEVPVLLLSGGMDPATPPRHGAAVAERLGNAKHVVAPS